MKREIKFRAWIKDEKKMIDVTSIYFDGYDGFEVSNIEYEALDHLEVELMQYTGLKDKNGKEIYEGDIVFGTGFGNKVIEYSEKFGAFGFKSSTGFQFIPLYFDCLFERRGNIYENPELL